MRFEVRHVRRYLDWELYCILCKKDSEDLWSVRINLEIDISNDYFRKVICCGECLGKYLKLLKPIEVQQWNNDRDIEAQLYNLQEELISKDEGNSSS
ncbi:MAG: hypothetical protein ACFE96_17010 [Candidatus Hermodarchaeota archaeon]